MKPVFAISANGNDITAEISARLNRLTIIDEAGLKSDALEIVIDDDGDIAVPSPGATLKASIGYDKNKLSFMGSYIADEITLDGWPQSMTIRAKAMDTSKAVTEHKTRSWDNITVTSIVQTIAGEHGLTPVVEPGLGAFAYEHIDQTDESDPHLLTRLAKDQDAIAAFKDGRLLFTAKGRGKSASGLALPVAKIHRDRATAYSLTLAERRKQKAVIAQWHDKQTGARRNVKIGSGSPVMRLRHVHASEAEATRAAQAKAREIARGGDTLSLTILGDQTIAAEQRIELSGLRPGVDGLWSIKTVNHEIAGGGFKSKIEAEKPS